MGHGLLQLPLSHSITQELSWKDPPPSSKQVSPIHNSAGTSHRVRNRNKEVLSVPQTHPPTRLRGCSTHPLRRPWASTEFKPCPQQLQSTRKMVQVLLTHTWQDNKQKVTTQLLVSSPSPWKSHLVLKQINILVLQGGIRTPQIRS